jgi:hypothetical protein
VSEGSGVDVVVAVRVGVAVADLGVFEGVETTTLIPLHPERSSAVINQEVRRLILSFADRLLRTLDCT